MFTELNITDSKILNHIYSPIGLDTGATTPEEIAISMVAEIRAVINQRSGQNLRERTDTIHPRGNVEI